MVNSFSRIRLLFIPFILTSFLLFLIKLSKLFTYMKSNKKDCFKGDIKAVVKYCLYCLPYLIY